MNKSAAWDVLLDPQRVGGVRHATRSAPSPMIDLIVFIAALGLVSAIMIASLFFG